MLLQISYRNGERRNINLHASFFSGDGQDKRQNASPERKADDLAWSLGRDPYKITITRGMDLIVDKTYRQNNPKEIAIVYEGQNVNEKKIKKELRKQFKLIPFSISVKLGQPIQFAV